jgi:hypothetical protein
MSSEGVMISQTFLQSKAHIVRNVNVKRPSNVEYLKEKLQLHPEFYNTVLTVVILIQFLNYTV